MPRTLGALLYDDFELLDLFGPLEMFGNMQGSVVVHTLADRPGLVRSAQGPRVQADHGLDDCPPLDLLLIPGGIGTRTQVDNRPLIEWLQTRAEQLEVAMTVCTGTALLAQAGLLDGRRATTNKMFFAWPESTWPAVRWVREARWVEDREVLDLVGGLGRDRHGARGGRADRRRADRGHAGDGHRVRVASRRRLGPVRPHPRPGLISRTTRVPAAEATGAPGRQFASCASSARRAPFSQPSSLMLRARGEQRLDRREPGLERRPVRRDRSRGRRR